MKNQTQGQLDERVSYYESPGYGIAKELQKRNYDYPGTRDRGYFKSIMVSRPPKRYEKPYEGCSIFKLNRTVRIEETVHLGEIFFENKEKGAKFNETWIFEVYKRENVPELTKLITELSEPYNVKVKIALCDNSATTKNYLNRNGSYDTSGWN